MYITFAATTIILATIAIIANIIPVTIAIIATIILSVAHIIL